MSAGPTRNASSPDLADGPAPGAAAARAVAGRRLLLAAALAMIAAAALLPLLGAPFAAAAALGAVGLVTAAAVHNVSLRVAPDDAAVARRLMAEAGAPEMRRPRGFEAEVALAYLVQQVVQAVAPFEKRDAAGRKVPLPMGQPRELSDLVRAQTGYCYDRSRAMETLLRLHGLKVRHIGMFTTVGGSALRTLLDPQAGSHSLCEVETERGWMVVDSNARWIGLSRDGKPYSIGELAALPAVDWDERNRAMEPRLQQPFVWYYGLYSRHGRFFPPYTPFPNVNWRELAANLGRLVGAR